MENGAFARILYTRSFNEKAVFEGEKIEMIDEISNKKLLPVPWLRLRIENPCEFTISKNANTDNEIAVLVIFIEHYLVYCHIKKLSKTVFNVYKKGLLSFSILYFFHQEMCLGLIKYLKLFHHTAEISVYPQLDHWMIFHYLRTVG